MPNPKTEFVHKMVQRSKKVVLEHTYKLLTENGISGVSIDEVARRSGVSKTTIYRHWPSRSALLLEACSKIGTTPTIPDTGSLKGDVTALASHLCQNLKSARWAVVLPSIIDAAERDPELAQLHLQLHAGNMIPFIAVAERAKKAGELPPSVSPTEFAAAVVSPFFYRRWFSREPLDDNFVKSVVRSVMIQIKQS